MSPLRGCGVGGIEQRQFEKSGEVECGVRGFGIARRRWRNRARRCETPFVPWSQAGGLRARGGRVGVERRPDTDVSGTGASVGCAWGRGGLLRGLGCGTHSLLWSWIGRLHVHVGECGLRKICVGKTGRGGRLHLRGVGDHECERDQRGGGGEWGELGECEEGACRTEEGYRDVEEGRNERGPVHIGQCTVLPFRLQY